MYDLDKIKYLEFTAQSNHEFKDGIYTEYYPNGMVKQVGNYTLYTIIAEPRDISWLSSLKDGKWLTYRIDGTLESEQHYNRGHLSE